MLNNIVSEGVLYKFNTIKTNIIKDRFFIFNVNNIVNKLFYLERLKKNYNTNSIGINNNILEIFQYNLIYDFSLRFADA